MNIAQEACHIVLHDRNASYGSPAQDYTRTAAVWSGLLCEKLKAPITAKEAILMMAAMKLCREMYKPKRDNRVDAIGYILCADWTETGIRPSNGPTNQLPPATLDVTKGEPK